MKKALSLLLCVILCISLLCACTTDDPDTSGSDSSVDTPSVDLSYDDVSYFIPGGNDSSTEESQTVSSGESSESGNTSAESSADISQPLETSKPTETQTGSFVIKLAKYDYNNTIEKQNTYYGGNDYGDVSIAVLDVTNKTDKNYSVKITGKYLDENGNVLKTETQEWDQFAAGWQKYFLFRPHMQFDRFEYTVETTEYSGDCWKCGYSIPFTSFTTDNRMLHPDDLDDMANAPSVEGIRANVAEIIDTPFPIIVGIQYLVLFDASDQVIGIYQSGEGDSDPHTDLQIRPYFNVYYSDRPKMDEWPERFKGNVTGITVVSWIKKK